MDNFFVYVLVSSDGLHRYVGMSENPERRLVEHNSGKVRSTKAFLPWIKVYEEFVGNREEARKREKYLKSAAGRRFLKKVTCSPPDQVGQVFYF